MMQTEAFLNKREIRNSSFEEVGTVVIHFAE
jgi:hypothetical protein